MALSGNEQNGAVRVLLVGDFPPPHGGVAVHVEMLLKAIRRAGGEAAVLDIGKGQVPADGVFPSGGYGTFAAQLTSFSARGYLVHLHTSGANPKSWLLAAACAAAGRASGKPAIITLHSGLLSDWLDASAPRRMLARALLGQFSTVVAVSDPIAAALRRCGVPDEHIVVVPAFTAEFIEPGELPHAAREVRERASPLLCAMLAPEALYGAKELFEAFGSVQRQRPDARLIVFGPGTNELGEIEHVRGLGELSRPAALAVMKAADIFVRPTLADGDSVSVREALALGRTVVCTSVGTRPDGVHLVPPGDAEALAAGLLRAIEGLGATASAPATDTDLLRVLLPRYGLQPATAVRAA